jgi:hypothetical protein
MAMVPLSHALGPSSENKYETSVFGKEVDARFITSFCERTCAESWLALIAYRKDVTTN